MKWAGGGGVHGAVLRSALAGAKEGGGSVGELCSVTSLWLPATPLHINCFVTVSVLLIGGATAGKFGARQTLEKRHRNAIETLRPAPPGPSPRRRGRRAPAPPPRKTQCERDKGRAATDSGKAETRATQRRAAARQRQGQSSKGRRLSRVSQR